MWNLGLKKYTIAKVFEGRTNRRREWKGEGDGGVNIIKVHYMHMKIALQNPVNAVKSGGRRERIQK
jgi:hypothetical protein